jgi:hypothetical protein
MTTSTIETTAKHLSIRVINERAFNFVLRIGLFVIIVLGVFYIMLTSSLATRGFELEALKNERLSITQELEKVEISATIPTSLYALRSSEIVQEMPNIRKQKFLKVMEGQVAMK